MTEHRKKLIEVALPLEAINVASAREKSIRHGHPSTLHLWWARRPLAACRAVLFASLVDDPSSDPDQFPTEAAQRAERDRLFGIIEELVKWENTTNETVLEVAREEIRKATRGNPPTVLDPFCGGGSIPLEAQRLGLEAHASDLNPVAVLITKALVEIPPRFVGRPPVNPDDRIRGMGAAWNGAAGLAADVRYYGKWLRSEAERRIGHLYPKVQLPQEYGGGQATVIAWLWARTVRCPSPACGAQMPLVRSFWLSTKKGREAWTEPLVDATAKTVRFGVRRGGIGPREGTVNRRGATCIVCGAPVPLAHIRAEGKAGRLGTQLMAIVAEGKRERVYLDPRPEHAEVAAQARPTDVPEVSLPEQALGFRIQGYGMTRFRDLFLDRQLVALTTFSDLVKEARDLVHGDAIPAGQAPDGIPLAEGGSGATAYADAVATYIGLAISKLADYNSSLVVWSQGRDQAVHTFGRQIIAMVWDFAEVNPMAGAAGDLAVTLSGICDTLQRFRHYEVCGQAIQADAINAAAQDSRSIIFSTDPPYYDNVPYADLSDFFYMWLRISLIKIFPRLFETLATPKTDELVASPFRFEGSQRKADEFFIDGLRHVFIGMRRSQDAKYPVTVYYAFKQEESDSGDEVADDGVSVRASTGWDSMLAALLTAGFSIGGTWPMRTERAGRLRDTGSNALASSIVLVCRPRPEDAPSATRREFLAALRRELPAALRKLQHGNIAPVDLAQASIGPGMAVFSRYARVLEADGSPMSVRTALGLINQALDDVLTEQEGEYDGDTRWAVAWFGQCGLEEGPYGNAETLSTAKNTAVGALVNAGIVRSGGGKVRLLRRDELPTDWDPATDRRLTVWEVTQHLIRAHDEQGESGAARLLARVGSVADAARDLAYRLYVTCDRKGWAQEALAYNALVIAWPEIARQARGDGGPSQGGLL